MKEGVYGGKKNQICVVIFPVKAIKLENVLIKYSE
jgi:hypothetical protein